MNMETSTLRRVPGLFGQSSPRTKERGDITYEDMSGVKAPRVSRVDAAFSPTGTALTGASTAWTKSFKLATQPGVAGSLLKAKDGSGSMADGVDDDDIEIEQDPLIELIDEQAFKADWYLAQESAATAASMLSGKNDGAFVITTGAHQGSLILHYNFGGSVRTATMYGDGSGIHLASSSLVFSSLSDIVRHYSKSSAMELPVLLDVTVVFALPQGPARPLYETMTPPRPAASSTATSPAVSRPQQQMQPPAPMPRPSISGGAPPGVPDRSSKMRTSSMSSGCVDPTAAVPKSPELPTLPPRMTAPVATTNSSSTLTVPGSEGPHPASPKSVPPSPSVASSATSPDMRHSSILRRPHVASPIRPSSRSGRVSFNEESIRTTRGEMQQIRGVYGCIDEEVLAAGYYIPGTTKEQALGKLRGAKAGSFLVVDSESADFLLLCHVNGGKVQQKLLEFTNPGIAVKDDKQTFETLSELIHHFGTFNKDLPFILNVSTSNSRSHDEGEEEEGEDAGDDFVQGEDGEGAGRGGEVDEEDFVEIESPRSKRSSASHPYVMFESLAGTPWYQSGLTRASANALIEFEPTGTFVVWDDPDNPGVFVLSYVKNGRLFHVNVEPSEKGFAVDGSTSFFKSMKELVKHYSAEDSMTPELGCRLRPPRSENVAPPSSVSDGGNAAGASGGGATKGHHQSLSPAHSGAGLGASGDSGFELGPRGQSGAHSPGPSTPASSPSVQRKARKESSQPRGGSGGSGGGGDDHRHQPMWLQLNLPKAQALAPIAGMGDGAFVIRSSESRPECLVLSYKLKGQIIYELIRQYAGLTVQFGLECASDRRFASLQELVKYYEVPRPELKYPLSCSSMGEGSSSNGVYGTLTSETGARGGGGGGGGGASSPARGSKAPSPGPHINRDDSKRSTRSTASAQSVPRQASRQQIQSGTPTKDGAKGKMTRGESRASIASSRSAGGGSTGPGGANMSRQTSKAALMKRQASGVQVIRTAGERLDQRAAMSAWFCMNVTKEEALTRMQKERQGAFLVRRASDAGFCTISYAYKGKVEHVVVEDTPSGLHVLKSQVYQPNLSALIAYYKLPEQSDLHCPLV